MANKFTVVCQHCGHKFDSEDRAFAKCPGCGRMLTLFPKPKDTKWARLRERAEALTAQLEAEKASHHETSELWQATTEDHRRAVERVEALEKALRNLLGAGLLSKDWPKVEAAARKLLEGK